LFLKWIAAKGGKSTIITSNIIGYQYFK